jgi:DNA topoisomerase-1
MSKLLIVESPSKAKTIEKYLSSNNDKYIVRASVGHIRDLPKSNKKAIDIEAGFIPHYEISKGKEKVVRELKTLALSSNEILLATDPDREGEAISWHIKNILDEDKKIKSPIKRITFNEITKEAIENALKIPRDIDDNLVKAQEARRVLDRLVGYDLSGVIWKKVRYGLSAGRVQSPALRILMEREREIRAFITEEYFVLNGLFETKEKSKINLSCSEEFKDKNTVLEIIEKSKKEKWSVSNVKETEQKRSPKAPFTTSTLQQTASTRLGFSPSRTMQIAQKLYENGHITYMRTDSTNISEGALKEIQSVIKSKYGESHIEIRRYKTKTKNAQEAHEAIRPTHVTKQYIGQVEAEEKLYNLIWERTVSSQMIDAKLLKTKIEASTKDKNIPTFYINGSKTINKGWLLVDKDSEGDEVNLPNLQKGDDLKLLEINETRKETTPPNRYSEAGLVKELEERGIGRPSTYASIIKTLEERGYVTKEGRTLFPTDTGDVVSSFLEQNFTKYISDNFTRDMEDELDDIANGKRKYEITLKDFYIPFQKDVKEKDKLGKITNLGLAPEEFKCPKCQKEMIIKLGKNGKFLSCIDYPNCIGARTIDGKEMEGPKDLGKTCPKCGDNKKEELRGKLVLREGRFGSFISCSRYPKCKYIEEDEEEVKKRDSGVLCPICKKSNIRERKGRFGIFYSCGNYPECKFIIKTKPTGNVCKYCDSLMMEGTKTIPERCSNKQCENHNPHKMKE